jgi:hypothetical protein
LLPCELGIGPVRVSREDQPVEELLLETGWLGLKAAVGMGEGNPEETETDCFVLVEVSLKLGRKGLRDVLKQIHYYYFL